MLINKTIKEAFKITLEERGIDIMNPERFIDVVYTNLSKENCTLKKLNLGYNYLGNEGQNDEDLLNYNINNGRTKTSY